MKKSYLFLAFMLLSGATILNSCGNLPATSESAKGVLQNSNSVFDPFASVSSSVEDNNSTNSTEEESIFPSRLIGTWDGEDDYGTPFVLVISDDGKAIITNENIEYHFTFSEKIGDGLSAEYIYTCDEANDDGVYIGVRAGNVNDIEFYDHNGTYFWMDDDFMIYSQYPIEIIKRYYNS